VGDCTVFSALSLFRFGQTPGRMSRNKAKKTCTLEDFKAQTAGVECRKDTGVIDEIPGAYKDIQSVMAARTGLVEVVAHLRQLVCVKG
jgi:tRNA-splicing ligase RtcB (3'-phosphate/5'-hydroxy nucleic acid ligase)